MEKKQIEKSVKESVLKGDSVSMRGEQRCRHAYIHSHTYA